MLVSSGQPYNVWNEYMKHDLNLRYEYKYLLSDVCENKFKDTLIKHLLWVQC